MRSGGKSWPGLNPTLLHQEPATFVEQKSTSSFANQKWPASTKETSYYQNVGTRINSYFPITDCNLKPQDIRHPQGQEWHLTAKLSLNSTQFSPICDQMIVSCYVNIMYWYCFLVIVAFRPEEWQHLAVLFTKQACR